jgi:hypothetical protein
MGADEIARQASPGLEWIDFGIALFAADAVAVSPAQGG